MTNKQKLLVVGGAGYIGSTTAYLLADSGYEIHLLDNLSTGYKELAASGRLHQIDLHDKEALDNLFKTHKFDGVLHFAAFIAVGESVQNPLDYYRNNVAGTINLLAAMQKHGVRKIVFSSTAAVYGEPEQTPIKENHPLAPINPYGWSKRIIEQILSDCDTAWGLKSVALRYFNAAGAEQAGRCGEWHKPETHLIPVAMRAALGEIDKLTIFGNDYKTPDGTCIRDYIHVSDLAKAHKLAIEYLIAGNDRTVFNLGSENGYSVSEVINTVENVTGIKVPYQMGARREGDPAILVASSEAIRKKLNWQRTCSDLETIVSDAWNWHKRKGFLGGAK